MNENTHVMVYAGTIDTQSQMYTGKIHLAPYDSGDIFCGSTKVLYNINVVDIDWVTQADPDSQLCQRCKKAAIKQLSQENKN